jgi:hypothetical protein
MRYFVSANSKPTQRHNMTAAHNRTAFIALLIVALFHVVLLFAMPLLPFIDLPNHLAEATVYKYAKEGTLLGQYYKAVPSYYPNTFHPVFCSLFPSVEAGNKVFYMLYVVLLLLSVYGIIKEVNGNPWYGLLSVIFIYNFNVIGGFTGFTISIPTTLLLFYVILLDVRNERWVYKLGAALLLVLLFLMHAQMALFGLAMYGAIMLYRHWGNFKTLFLNVVLVPLPVIAMVVIWWANRAAAAQEQESTASFLLDYYKRFYFPEFLLRFRIAVFDNFSLRAGAPGLAIAAVLFLLPFLPLLYYKAWKGAQDKNVLKTRLAYPLVFLAISIGCYLFLPSKLPGQAIIYERFSPLVMLALIITGSVLLKNVQTRGLKYFVIGAVCLYTVLWAEYFYKFNRENREFTPALFSGVPTQAKLGGLVYDYRYRGRYTYLHFPNYVIVWNKGLAATKMIDYRFVVVTRGERGKEIPVYNEWIGRTYTVEKAYDSTLSYLLVRGKAPAQPDSNILNATAVRQAGLWGLYKNNRLSE